MKLVEYIYKNPWDIPPKSRVCHTCGYPLSMDFFHRVIVKRTDDSYIVAYFNFCSAPCSLTFMLGFDGV